MRRASEQAARADLVLWVVDASGVECASGRRALRARSSVRPRCVLWVVVEQDRSGRGRRLRRIESEFERELTVHLLSSQTGEGVDELVNALARFAERFFTPEPALVTRRRQRAHLQEAAACAARRRRARRRTAARRSWPSSCGLRPGRSASSRPGRRRGYSGRDLSRFLHRQVGAESSGAATSVERGDSRCGIFPALGGTARAFRFAPCFT